MNKKIRLAAVLLGICLFAGCSQNQNVDKEIKLPIYDETEISYNTYTVQYDDISETTNIGAFIGYPYAVYYNFPRAGTVISTNVKKGQSVKQGDVLAVVDSSGLDYEITNQTIKTQAALNNASATGSTLDSLTYQIEQKSLELLNYEKSLYELKAPFDGIITDVKRFAEGDQVDNETYFCGLAKTDEVYVYATDKTSNLRFGMDVRVKIGTDYYDGTLVSAPDMAPSGASQTAKSLAIVDLGDAVKEVREKDPSMIEAGWATIYAKTAERNHVLVVPDSAVKTYGGKSYVTLLLDGERINMNISIGASLGGYTEVVSGISEGDIVIIDE